MGSEVRDACFCFVFACDDERESTSLFFSFFRRLTKTEEVIQSIWNVLVVLGMAQVLVDGSEKVVSRRAKRTSVTKMLSEQISTS